VGTAQKRISKRGKETIPQKCPPNRLLENPFGEPKAEIKREKKSNGKGF